MPLRSASGSKTVRLAVIFGIAGAVCLHAELDFVTDDSSIVLNGPGAAITFGSQTDIVVGKSVKSRIPPDRTYNAGESISWTECENEGSCQALYDRLREILRQLDSDEFDDLLRRVQYLEHHPLYVQEGIEVGGTIFSRGIEDPKGPNKKVNNSPGVPVPGGSTPEATDNGKNGDEPENVILEKESLRLPSVIELSDDESREMADVASVARDSGVIDECSAISIFIGGNVKLSGATGTIGVFNGAVVDLDLDCEVSVVVKDRKSKVTVGGIELVGDEFPIRPETFVVESEDSADEVAMTGEDSEIEE